MITSWDVVASTGSGGAENTVRKRVDTVLINTDSTVLDRLTLERYYRFPQYFSSHPQDDLVFFLNYDWRPKEGSIQQVQLEYSNQMPDAGKYPGGGNPFQYIENPLARPTMIARNTYSEMVLMDIDSNGKKVETTAGEPIPLFTEYHYTNFLVTKNINRPFTIGVAALQERQDSMETLFSTDNPTGSIISLGKYPDAFDSVDFLNSDTVKMKNIEYPPGTLWATNFQESEYKIENRYVFYTLQFEIRHRPSGWYRRVINAGYLWNKPVYPPNFVGPLTEEQYDALPKVSERIKVGDPPGYPRQPVPLDRKGRPFMNADGDIITSERGGLRPNQIVYRHYVNYQNLNFGANFPNLNGVGIFQ